MLRILHCADLHLDSPFRSLPPESAARRREQLRRLPAVLVDLVREHRCDLLLLAGDVCDRSSVCPETRQALVSALASCPVPVLIAPGNHDPYTASSLWAAAEWPEHIHIFSGAMTCVSLPHLNCRVWGGGFRRPNDRDLLQPIPPADDGWLEIGLFHGDPLSDSAYHPISAQQIASCGLDYLALGHIHKIGLPRRMGHTWYGWPGAAAGRGFDETGEKGVLLISLSQQCCQWEFLPLPLPRYSCLELPARELLIPPAAEGTICRLVLTGESDPVDMDALHRQLQDRFVSLEILDRTVPIRALWSDSGDTTLRGLALQILKAQYDSGDPEQQQTATLAARYLLAALEGREEP